MNTSTFEYVSVSSSTCAPTIHPGGSLNNSKKKQASIVKVNVPTL
jgi:hypothetical protein